MRLGVLDVGSNTVHLLIVDAHRGAAPNPAASVKEPLRLAELLKPDGSLSGSGARRLVDAVGSAQQAAAEYGVEDMVAFATSAVRDARNAEQVLEQVRAETGVDLQTLPGDDEARLTFLAVRRWFGWQARRLLVLDIGGGSLEVAGGVDEEPDLAVSLPLGAGRLTRDRLSGDPPKRSAVAALRDHVRDQLEPLVDKVADTGTPSHVVGTSKTFRSLARIGGAAPYSQGPYVRRELTRATVSRVRAKISRMPSGDRAQLPGVSESRARQLLAGAIVAETAMKLLDVRVVEICPWALREGVILRRLDWLTGG